MPGFRILVGALLESEPGEEDGTMDEGLQPH